jgi:hypothetical protein
LANTCIPAFGFDGGVVNLFSLKTIAASFFAAPAFACGSSSLIFLDAVS